MKERGEYVYGTDGNEGHWLTGERIVRCRDCENAIHFFQWLTPSKRATVETWMCRNMGDGMETDPNGFCAWGKRKESE